MQNPLKKLIQSLQQVDTLYEEVLRLLQLEKEAALASDIQRLVAATDEKRRLLAKIKEVDQGRALLLKQIAAGLKLPVAELNLRRLADQVDPRHGHELEQLNGALRRKMVRIRQVNKESRVVFLHCLNLVQNSLSFLNFWTKGSAVYGSSGAVRSGESGGHLVSNSA